MSSVQVISGMYRNKRILDQTFTLLKSFQSGKKGNYITVRNDGQVDTDLEVIKIKVDNINQLKFVDGEFVQDKKNVIQLQVPTESDNEAMDRIASRFSILDKMTKAAIAGDIRAMIVSGPPGVGKSYGVETQLDRSSKFDILAGRKVRYEVVKGAITALGLYAQLYKFSDAKNILVFDDCDSVFGDELSLNILKAALDSGKRRKICWNSDSVLLRREGIPDQFDFKGSVIFITNLNFGNVKSKKLQDHLEALQSRCHYLNLTIDSERDKILRIKQVHRDASVNVVGGLFADYGFEGDESTQILDFMWESRVSLREISLRCALKIADLMKIDPDNWKNLAKVTICKN